MKRYESPDDEDAFCEQILLLGAKWWSSYARFSLLKGAELHEEDCILLLEEGEEPEPEAKREIVGESSVAEQRWACSVGVRHNFSMVMTQIATVLSQTMRTATVV